MLILCAHNHKKLVAKLQSAKMRQAHETLTVSTRGTGMYEVTEQIQAWVQSTSIKNGLLTLFCQHTSASLTIQENADSDVQKDLISALNILAPADPERYLHSTEGPDDMPAHIKSALTDVSISVPVTSSRAQLGVWQGIYLCEHRRAPHLRNIALHLFGA